MAPRLHLESIDTLTMEEHHGAVVRMTRGAKVTGLTKYTRAQGGSYRTLQEALNMPNMPQPGSGLTGLSGGLGFANELGHLRLSGRIPKMLEKRTCHVDLIYENVLAGGENQDISPENSNPLNIYWGEHKASLVQRKTNQYRENGIGPNLPLFVEHRYPNTAAENLPGVLQKQGGEINIHEPQKNYKFGGYMNTIWPWVITDRLLGTINLTAWLNLPTAGWMCTEVAYKMIKYGRYLFHFEFQSNLDLWNPEIVFIDSRTGRPAQNLVDTVGRKKIPYYRPINFNLEFNATFEGWGLLIIP